MAARKGRPKPPGSGRKVGSRTRITMMRESILAAAETVGDRMRDADNGQGSGAGGAERYLEWAAIEEPKAFISLMARLLPAELHADITTDGVPTVVVRNYSGLRAEPGELPAIDAESTRLDS